LIKQETNAVILILEESNCLSECLGRVHVQRLPESV
jgi:hypothetical protein